MMDSSKNDINKVHIFLSFILACILFVLFTYLMDESDSKKLQVFFAIPGLVTATVAFLRWVIGGSNSDNRKTVSVYLFFTGLFLFLVDI